MQLNPGTLCADSLIGLKEILRKQSEYERTNHVNENDPEYKSSCSVKMEIYAATELVKAGMFETELIEGQCESLGDSSSKVPQVDNELTPSRNRKTMVQCLKPSKYEYISFPEKSKVRKKLSFAKECSPTSFTLGNLHKHMLGVPPAQSHGAEADCLALLRTTAVLGSDWINWIQDNCELFSNSKKMWAN
jgi:hypothetical protein